MNINQESIDNLQINKVTDDIVLIHQINVPSHFSCSDGLLILPKQGRNSRTIALDLNIEPEHIKAINKTFGPVSDYVNTHGHMDHIAHVYAWEQLGVTIHAPAPEAKCLTSLNQFYKGFSWQEMNNFSLIEQFAELNKFQTCENVVPFKPGDVLKFEDLIINTIPFTGHSKSHVGFLLPSEKILHVSCLGFDQPRPGVNGFGPWYGFEHCSISKYFHDIDHAESLFLKKADYLTSSHAYIVKKPDITPFEYMRNKLNKNQQIVDQGLKTLDFHMELKEKVNELLKRDLFFPKVKMKRFLFDIYSFWESWIIRHHIEQNESLKL